jgi:hypothetical protein
MLTVLELLFSPAKTWDAIAQKQHGVFRIFILSILPLILISCVAEAYALMTWGIRQGIMGHFSPVHQDQIIRYAEVQLGLSLILLFGGAKFIQWLAEGFNFSPKFTPVFTAFGYGLGPVFLTRIMNCVPVANSWVWWMLGAACMVFILYHGVALVIQPDQSKGFGFYILSALAIVIMSGIAQAVAVAVLRGRLVMF